MRKHITSIWLFLLFSLFVKAQTDDKMVWKRVDSLKNELKTAKGEKKVNCLNLLAEYYFFIWDEDDKLQDTACIFSDQAFAEAKKINYKVGLAYALANRAHCAAGETDNNIKNNDTESTYANAYKLAGDAIKYAEGLNNNYIIGSVYDVLKWMERWRGTTDKYKTNLEKAILYYEKVTGNEFKGNYKPLFLADCPGCKGAESELGGLYLQLASTESVFNTKESLLQKAINYIQRAGTRSDLANAYTSHANALIVAGNIETSVNYFKKALELYQQDENKYGEARTYTSICSALFRQGDFENGIEYSKKSVALAEKIARENGRLNQKDYYLYNAYYWMGRFYGAADDMETAFSYLFKAKFYNSNKADTLNCLTAIAEFHRDLGNYDSAMHYLSFTINNDIGIGKRILSALYISLKQYDKALELINKFKTVAGESNDIFNLSRNDINAAKAYYGKNDYMSALANAREGMALLKKIGHNSVLIEAYQLLSDIFYKTGNTDSAYYYLKQYTTLKDSLMKKQLYIKLNNYKREAEDAKRTGQIKLLQKDYLIKEQELQHQMLLKEQSNAQLTILDKDNEIKDQKLKEEILLKEQNRSQLVLSDNENKLKDQRLKQQAIIRNALLAGLLLFLLLSVFIIRSLSLKRKNEKLAIEKKQAELQQKVAELEMQALRTQMNPHFIFNSLNSINRFIFKNETQAASDYLTRFSRLIRMVLLHSQKKLVPLEDELEMLKLYLDMERLRFKNAFDYHITTTNAIENTSIFIPPLLLQPFCENAIWHGLMHKDGKGHLNIDLSDGAGVLLCTITDDGVGREKAEEYKSKSAEKEKSLGLKITKERLSLLNQGSTGGTFYEIKDVMNEKKEVAGTRVQLKIRYKENIEELV